MDKTLAMITKSFEVNRQEAERFILERRREIKDHKHGFFCFKWRQCRKLEKAVADSEARVRGYRAAEKDMAEGKYDKAIAILGFIADDIDESPLEVVSRVASMPPTLGNILNSRSSVAFRMRQARDYLLDLQNKANPQAS